MGRLAGIGGVALALTSAGGCGATGSREGSNAQHPVCARATPAVVARVGNDRITNVEFAAVMNESRGTWAAAEQPYPDPCSRKHLDLVRQAVELLVERSRNAQAAASVGAVVTDEVVSAALARMKITRHELTKVGRTEAEVRAEARSELLEYATYMKVVAGIEARDVGTQLEKRHAAWRHWLERTTREFADRTVYTHGYDPVQLPKNVWPPGPALPQRPMEACNLGPGAYTYEQLVARRCAADFPGVLRGPGDVPCPDLYYDDALWPFVDDEYEDGFTEYEPDPDAECVPPPPWGGEIVIGLLPPSGPPSVVGK